MTKVYQLDYTAPQTMCCRASGTTSSSADTCLTEWHYIGATLCARPIAACTNLKIGPRWTLSGGPALMKSCLPLEGSPACGCARCWLVWTRRWGWVSPCRSSPWSLPRVRGCCLQTEYRIQNLYCLCVCVCGHRHLAPRCIRFLHTT